MATTTIPTVMFVTTHSVYFSCLDSLTNMVDVKWVHVKAHCGEPGNEAADRLARDGAKL